jgi:hypothetical protein
MSGIIGDPAFIQSVKELLLLITLVIVLGLSFWLIIYFSLLPRFWKQRGTITRYPTRCATLAARVSLGIVIVGTILGLLIFGGVLTVYIITKNSIDKMNPDLLSVPLLDIIVPILISSVILGSLIEARISLKRISPQDFGLPCEDAINAEGE